MKIHPHLMLPAIVLVMCTAMFAQTSPDMDSRIGAAKSAAALDFRGTFAQSPRLRPLLANTSLLHDQTLVGAMTFIDEHKLEGRIYHPQVFGDYLIWRLWPRHKSFVDGRVHLFGFDFFREINSLFQDSHWEDRLSKSKWNIRYLLLQKASADPDAIRAIATAKESSRWKQLYEDDVAILFEKRE